MCMPRRDEMHVLHISAIPVHISAIHVHVIAISVHVMHLKCTLCASFHLRCTTVPRANIVHILGPRLVPRLE
jgi:hypothetical protein